MIGKVFGILTILSFVCGAATGRLGEVSAACVSGAARAIDLSLGLMGMMCFWSGMMRVMERLGVTRILSRMLSPLMKPLFPDAMRLGKGGEEIATAVAANLLGLSNAATPLAVRAMKTLAENEGGNEVAGDDMVTFAMLGCCCPCLIPTTLFALLADSGSAHPFALLLPIWGCSAVCSGITLVLARGMRHLFPRGRRQ